jgi:hypothetical protein
MTNIPNEPSDERLRLAVLAARYEAEDPEDSSTWLMDEEVAEVAAFLAQRNKDADH